MNRRGAGIGFCFISAFLFSAKYITAAIFGSGVLSWNSDLFKAMFSYVGNGLETASIVALVIGALYLLAAEIDDRKNKALLAEKQEDEENQFK